MAMRPGPYEHFRTERTFAALERFGEAARDRGVSPGGLALAWVLAQPDVTAAIVGPRRPEHLAAVAEALGLELSAAEADEVASPFDGR
jgi:aryl-alcohol dehydrogenase-like predicted oxidoreductase